MARRQAAHRQLDALYDAALGGWGRKQKYPPGARDLVIDAPAVYL